MNFEMLESVFRYWAQASVHGALLVMIILGIQWFAGDRLSPRWRHALWIVLLIRLGIPTLPESPFSPLNLTPTAMSWTPKTEIESAVIPTTRSFTTTRLTERVPSPISSIEPSVPIPNSNPTKPPVETSPEVPSSIPMSQIGIRALSVIWLVVSIGTMIRLMFQSWSFTQKINRTTKATHPRIQQAFESACGRLGIKTECVTINTTPAVRTPCLLGLRRPRLLLPIDLADRLSPQELEWVCMHELAHYKRHDILFTWIESILQCVHWFNPIIWFGFRCLRADRELATDDLVLRTAGSAQTRGYGETIVKLLQGINRAQSPQVGVIGITEQHTRIKQRIHAIAAFSPKRRYPIAAALGSIALVLLFVLEGQSKPAQSPSQTKGTQMSGHLREYQTQAPISNATLRVTVLRENDDPTGSSPQIRETFVFQTTHDGGVVNLSDLPPDVKSMTIVMEHPDFLTAHRSFGQINQTQIPTDMNLEMIPPANTSGTVTTALQRPIQGASVYPHFTQPEGEYFEKYYIPRPETPAVTDDKGHWTARSVPAGLSTIDIYVTHPDYAVTPRSERLHNNQRYSFFRQQRGTMESLREGSFTTIMKRGTRLRGTVRHHGNQPVPNAQIEIMWAHIPPTMTDEQGKFEVPIALTGPVTLMITAPGFSPFEVTQNILPLMPPISYDLQSGRSLTIKFVDEMGHPIDKVSASPSKWSYIKHATGQGNRLSDTAGLWTWNNAPNEELTFHFFKEGYRRIQNIVLEPREEPHVVQMKRALEVLFVITDSNGRPIEDVRLYRSSIRSTVPLHTPPYSWQRIQQVHYPELKSPGVGAPVGFKVFESEPEISAQPDEQTYFTYRAEAPGFRSALSSHVSASEHQVTLSLELQKAPAGPRQLLQPNGVPLTNERLWLLDPSHTYRVHESMLFVRHRDEDIVRTDQDGFFELPMRDQPFWVLALMEEGFLLVPDHTPGPFVLRPWATLKGTWTEGGRPGEGIELGVKLRTPKPFLSFSKRVRLDDEGAFQFSKVPPGEIEVVADLAVGSDITYHRSIETRHLAPGLTETLDVKLPHSRAVSGRIKVSKELRPRIPLNTVALLLHHENHAEQALYGQLPWIIHIDEDGYFLTPRLVAGRYTAEIRMSEFRPPNRNPLISKVLATASPQFTIDSTSPETIDLGTIDIDKTKL